MWAIRPKLLLRGALLLAGGSAAIFAMVLVESHARKAQRREQCVNNLKQIGLGMHNYFAVYDVLPAGTEAPPGMDPGQALGWRAGILTFLEARPCLPRLDPGASWDSPGNLAPILDDLVCEDKLGNVIHPNYRQIITYSCPSIPDDGSPDLPALSPYVGIAGLGLDAPDLPATHPRAGIMARGRRTTFAEVRDGLSQTMMIAETARDPGPWTAGGEAAIRGLDPDRPPYLGGGRGQFGGIHPGGANVLFADGSVKFVRSTIAPATFEALSTIAGGDPTPGWPGP